MKKIILTVLVLFSINLARAQNINQPKLPDNDAANINQPAPAFVLKDLDGKLVRLEDYRGKTVILDFWATWCYPCRKSMPVMNLIVNKYKDAPDVIFLFIDTREKADDYLSLVKNFLKATHYPFHVLLDEVSSDGQMNVTYQKYVMPGIPTKYIIDPNGIIRFRNIGFYPRQSRKEAMAEIVNEIEQARSQKS